MVTVEEIGEALEALQSQAHDVVEEYFEHGDLDRLARDLRSTVAGRAHEIADGVETIAAALSQLAS